VSAAPRLRGGRASPSRRLRFARLGAFKPMADFDWQWPTKIDRAAIEELSTLDFLDKRANVVLVGPNGIGKTMIARNLAHRALLRGDTVRFPTASALLNDLAAEDSASALGRRLRHYWPPPAPRPWTSSATSPTRGEGDLANALWSSDNALHNIRYSAVASILQQVQVID
jgi:IstB-like ATP binding protein